MRALGVASWTAVVMLGARGQATALGFISIWDDCTKSKEGLIFSLLLG